MHRAGAPRRRDAHGLGHVGPQVPGPPGTKGKLGQRRRDADLVKLLEGARAILGAGRIAAQKDDRAFRLARHVERAQAAGEPGSGGDHGDPDAARQLGVGVGHVDGSTFVAGVDQADTDVDAGIEDRHDLVSGKREDHLHAGSRQCDGDKVRTSHEFALSLIGAVMAPMIPRHNGEPPFARAPGRVRRIRRLSDCAPRSRTCAAANPGTDSNPPGVAPRLGRASSATTARPAADSPRPTAEPTGPSNQSRISLVMSFSAGNFRIVTHDQRRLIHWNGAAGILEVRLEVQ